LEAKFWLIQAEEKFKEDVFDRDGGICVCGSPIEVIHHLLGRSKLRGWKGWPENIKTVWDIRPGDFTYFSPHNPLNGRGLCLHHHVPFAHRFGRFAKKLLLIEILSRCGDMRWAGSLYSWWYRHPPFVEFLG